MVHALYTDSRCSLLFPFNKKIYTFSPFYSCFEIAPPICLYLRSAYPRPNALTPLPGNISNTSPTTITWSLTRIRPRDGASWSSLHRSTCNTPLSLNTGGVAAAAAVAYCTPLNTSSEFPRVKRSAIAAPLASAAMMWMLKCPLD